MKQIPRFPKINIKKAGKDFEGLAGIKLTSILKGDLILNLLPSFDFPCLRET